MAFLDVGGAATELYERADELASVTTAIRRTAAGEGGLVVLEGPAGIGKTRLLEATRHAAADGGLRVLTARGGELERDFAYGVVRQLLEREVVGASPDTRKAMFAGPAAHAARALEVDEGDQPGRSAEDQAFAVRHGLFWLLANVAAMGPVLVAVDDVQWADGASLRFLAYLARRLEGMPLLLAVTARTGDPAADEQLLCELIDDATAQRLTPGPLGVESASALLSRLLKTPVDPRFAAACHTASGGNPFLLHELCTSLARDGVGPTAANADRVTGLGPATVARSLILRLTRVSPAAVRFARVVSVLGATADLADAGALSGLPPADAGLAFDGLARAGVLARDRPLRFAHPIMRDAVYHDLAPAEREALHALAARRLLTRGAPASEVAAHLLATPATGDTSVVEPLRAAASVALSQGAADLAARYLRRALEEPPADEELPGILADLGRATWLAGDDPLGAVGHLRAALEKTTDEQTRTGLVIALARAVFSTGDARGAGEVVSLELAREVGRSREETLTLEAEFGSIQLLFNGAAEVGEHIMGFADLAGETPAEMLVLTNVATWLWVGGTADEAADVAERSLGEGRAVEAAGADSIAVLQAAWVLSYAERQDLAQATLEAMLADARATGSVFGLTASSTMNALVAYRRGDVLRAEAEARNAMAVPGLPPFVHPTLHAMLCLALVEQGDLEEAERVIAASWVGPYLPVMAHMSPACWALGRLRMTQTRHEEARDAFLDGLDRDRQLRASNPGIPWRLDAAMAMLALDERDEAIRLVGAHEEHARRWGTHGAIGAWLHASGLVEADDARAIALLEEAVEVLDRSPARLDHARAVVDLGGRLRRGGHRAQARDVLQAGQEAARRCGASLLVRRAHDELRVAGARPRRLQFSGVDALTASERRVCDLAATGRSNRDIAQELFVTPKTVENHLGRAYVKLGIGSREELARHLG